MAALSPAQSPPLVKTPMRRGAGAIILSPEGLLSGVLRAMETVRLEARSHLQLAQLSLPIQKGSPQIRSLSGDQYLRGRRK